MFSTRPTPPSVLFLCDVYSYNDLSTFLFYFIISLFQVPNSMIPVHSTYQVFLLLDDTAVMVLPEHFFFFCHHSLCSRLQPSSTLNALSTFSIFFLKYTVSLLVDCCAVVLVSVSDLSIPCCCHVVRATFIIVATPIFSFPCCWFGVLHYCC